MAAFSSLPSALGGGLNPFQAIWAPLLGAAVSQTRARPAAAPVALPPLPAAPSPMTPPSSPPSSPSPSPSSPSPTPAPSTPAPSDPPPSPPAEADAPGAVEPPDGGPTPRLETSAERRARGRASLITTSLRGVLTPRPSGLTRKTLLGE